MTGPLRRDWDGNKKRFNLHMRRSSRRLSHFSRRISRLHPISQLGFENQGKALLGADTEGPSPLTPNSYSDLHFLPMHSTLLFLNSHRKYVLPLGAFSLCVCVCEGGILKFLQFMSLKERHQNTKNIVT